ncbi:MAG TPA: alpha-amylase family glycosyl hydrolase [Chitinophagales bacterium]|nr:alpha-amylase family glycosyl hydrolase [Chitinophagales bacterium]
MSTLFLLLSPLILISSCRNMAENKAMPERIISTVPEVSSIVMYELFIHNFSKEGTINAVTARLDEIKELGVNTIWLMPIQPIGQQGKKGTYGSPYSISDYYAINPDYGTKADFKRLVDSVHAKGLYVIIDEVANHTAWDNVWVKDHPEWYTKDSTGKMIPPVADWTDVVDLNFENQELRAEMIKSMKYWIDSFNIDGYRCDVAGMVPFDWWKECITELRKSRHLLMLAEGDDPKLYESGFDMTYGWQMYQALKQVWSGKSPIAKIDSVLEKEKKDYPYNYRPLRFTDNHDENSWDNIPAVKFQSVEGSKAAFVVMATLPGVPLLYNGQEVGYDTRINLFEKYTIDWSANRELRKFYKDILHLYHTNEILRDGTVQRIATENRDVLMYTRTLNDSVMVVMVNVRNTAIKTAMPKELMSKNYSNALTNEQVTFSYDLTFKPYEFKILRALSPE